MWLEKNIRNSRKVEKHIIVAIFLFFLIISGKYFFFSSAASKISLKVSSFIIKKKNAEYLKHVQEKKEISFKEFVLARDSGGSWSLSGLDGGARDYLIENKNGMIAIKRLQDLGAGGINIDVDNVGSYFSYSDIVTDIPYTQTGESFLVPEQEDLFPIFGYHNIFSNDDNVKDPYSGMRERDFKNQIHFYNQEMNCQWLTLGNVVSNFIVKKQKIPRNTCVMNFDDGRKNNYDTVFPVLKENNVYATFFIIFGHLGKNAYMTNLEVSELFRAGNEIGSHTIIGGGLVNTGWFKDGEFTKETLFQQISGSKIISEDYSYNSKIFAYPLGEWNNEVVSFVKEAGYIAARDVEKDQKWRSRRALATSSDVDFIWHLNYYKPELRYNEEIKREAGYDGWWQFEEGNLIINDGNNNVKIDPGIKITEQSYAVVSLLDIDDANENSFILENDGHYIIEMLLANNSEDMSGFIVLVDGNILNARKDASQGCILNNGNSYCHYLLDVYLLEGEHKLKIINKTNQTNIDKFKISRIVPMAKEYRIKISEHN